MKKNKRVVTFGEVMCRFCPPDHLRFEQVSPGSWQMTFGGAESSVAASVARFGGEAEFVSALPDHPIADSCIHQLLSMGVSTTHILRLTGHRMGVYFVERGANQRASQVIYDRIPSAFSESSFNQFNWTEIFTGASWFHTTGITSSLSRQSADAVELAVQAAKEAGLTVSIDLNFRAKLWQWEAGVPAKELARKIMPRVVQHADVLIGNEEDAHKTLGIKPRGTNVDSGILHAEGFASMAEEIMDRFPNIKIVATTLRESISATHNNWGAILSVRGHAPILSPRMAGQYSPYEIRSIIDRVGGGDAFAGALIYALNSGSFESEQAALDFATAASCLAHSISGDYNVITRKEVNDLVMGGGNGRVQR